MKRSYLKRKDTWKGFKRPASRKALGTKKPKEGSKRFYEKQLESLNAQYVKLRDGFQCRQCKYDNAPTVGILDAGHIYPKGKFPSGKFLTSNIVAQCRNHNTIHISRPEFMMIWYQRECGEDALIALHDEVLSMPRTQSVEWLKEQIALREQQISELRTHYEAQT